MSELQMQSPIAGHHARNLDLQSLDTQSPGSLGSRPCAQANPALPATPARRATTEDPLLAVPCIYLLLELGSCTRATKEESAYGSLPIAPSVCIPADSRAVPKGITS